MELLKRILLATDLGESSENLVKNALVLAKTFQSQIFLIHVLPEEIKDKNSRSILQKASTKELEVISNSIKKAGIKTENPVIKFGKPSVEITQTADSLNVNVILIGSGGTELNSINPLGTVAERIIRRSHKPVFVIKKNKPLKIRKILCPVDFSPESKRALKNTITLARRFKAELFVLNVHEIQYTGSLPVKLDSDKENEYQKRVHSDHFDKFLKAFDFTNLKWHKEIIDGDPVTEIQDGVSTYKPDLLIMGTSGRSGASILFIGSVTQKVIRNVQCSFITLKSEDIIILEIESKIRDIESHYSTANQLMEDGFYKESINEFKICLDINGMHIPSHHGISKAYENLNDDRNAERHRNIARDILSRIWDRKIESEIRKFYRL